MGYMPAIFTFFVFAECQPSTCEKGGATAAPRASSSVVSGHGRSPLKREARDTQKRLPMVMFQCRRVLMIVGGLVATNFGVYFVDPSQVIESRISYGLQLDPGDVLQPH